MTGPEHYREAERLLAGRTFPADPELHIEERQEAPSTDELMAAVGHALLANAAAAALNDHDPTGDGMPRTDYREWLRVAGITQPKGDGR